MTSNRCSTNHIYFTWGSVSESLYVLFCNGFGHGHDVRAAAEAWPYLKWKRLVVTVNPVNLVCSDSREPRYGDSLKINFFL